MPHQETVSKVSLQEARRAFGDRIAAELEGGIHQGIALERDMSINASGVVLAARLYQPEVPQGNVGMVFFHSGGYVMGNLATGDPVARSFCRHTGWPVLSVDYRLAPEHPFPAAVEDAVSSTQWAIAHGEVFGDEVRRVVVGGDSAGGGLAAVVAQSLRHQVPGIAGQCLLYPQLSMLEADIQCGPSLDPFVTAEALAWSRHHYIDASVDPTDYRVSPGGCRDLVGLPPTVIAVSGLDPLTRSAEAYETALREAGVSTSLRHYPHLPHGFAEFDSVSAAAEAAMMEIGRDCLEAMS
jgi:acetyl esterase